MSERIHAEVIELIKCGCSDGYIAIHCNVSVKTVQEVRKEIKEEEE